ncbi:MAG: acyltransferase [Bacteroidia bacterium]
MINQKSTVIYFNNLDSFRAIAAFLVIFYHIATKLNFPQNQGYYYLKELLSFKGQGGPFGVTFFFILSGFLITYLMFAELEKTGSFSILRFYMRRLLRIWPLYYLTLIIGFVIYPLMMHLSGIDYSLVANGWLYVLFLTNFDAVYTNHPVADLLSVQWSVAIEEQFYLVWPLIFSLSNKKVFPFVLIAVVIWSQVYFGLQHDWKFGYYHTFSNIRFLAAGAFLATITYHYPGAIKKIFSYIPKSITLVIYLTGTLLLFFGQTITAGNPVFNNAIHFIAKFFFLYVIAEQTFSENRLFNMGASKLLTSLGKISYGLYLIHMIAITIVTAAFNNQSQLIIVQVLLVLLLTIILSHLSYRYYERYFLKLKDRFSSVKTGNATMS